MIIWPEFIFPPINLWNVWPRPLRKEEIGEQDNQHKFQMTKEKDKIYEG